MEKLPVPSALLTSEYYASTPNESWKASLFVAINSCPHAPSLSSKSRLEFSTSLYDESDGRKKAHWFNDLAAPGLTARTRSYDIFYVVSTLRSTYSCIG
jgi:hypothetical protein